MPVTFGSVGDIIAVSLLVKDLLIALNDSRGSSAEYQAVVRELYILDTALLQVEQLSRSRAPTPELHALYDTANQTVAKCRDSVAEFIARIKKYSGSLAVGGSGNIFKDTTRKIQWRASQRDADIAKFRAEVTGYSDSINMLLATGMVKLLITKNDDLKDRLAEDGRRTHAALDIHSQALEEVRIRLDDNRQMISAGNSLASRMMDRLEWIQKLGSELKRFMSNVIAGNIAIYREVVAIRSAFSAHVDRPLLEDPFILEDAIGRIAPVHLRFINSWAAFQAVMEIRFQGKQGLRKICRKEYVLQESATGKEVDLSLDFEGAFLPGQKITMSLVFKRNSTEQSTQNSAHCPRCNTLSELPTNVDVLCPACNMWFRRVTEVHEVDLPHPTARNTKVYFGELSFGHVQFGPKPLKRKLEEVDGEDGDYSRFKRIRVVSEAKRVKAPKIFVEAKQIRAFHTAGEIGNNKPSRSLNPQPTMNYGVYRGGGPGSDIDSVTSGYYTQQAQSITGNEPERIGQELPSVVFQLASINVNSASSEATEVFALGSDTKSQYSHRSVSQGKALFKCPRCNEISRCPSDMKKHMFIHKKPHKCDFPGCRRGAAGKGFTTVNDLDRHRKSVHRIGVEKDSYQCASENCRNREKIWPCLGNFKQHICRMHKGEDEQDLIRRSSYQQRYQSTPKVLAVAPIDTSLAGIGTEK